MKYPHFRHTVTGVVVPLSAIKSRKSLGIGEFADLPMLGRWAASVGIELIQILPVNDTGFETSPYSALSAFALHPVYARLDDFPEAANPEDIAALRSELKNRRKKPGTVSTVSGITPGNINFDTVLAGKMRILRSMWKNAAAADIKKAEKWAKNNPWVQNYALFSLLKEENELKSWVEWKEFRNPERKDLSRLWKKKKDKALFWVWLQWRLEEQFAAASRELDSLGVALKGDIPILINEDSADLWAERDNFNREFRAGSPDGQNWGFPIYNWEYLRSEDYRWWRDRLNQAAKFYHAWRIDHVLGFFRIWAVPKGDFSAWNGYFKPSAPVTRAELEALGFDTGRITWLSRAHFPGNELREIFGDEAGLVQKMLEQVGSEDLWRSRPDGPDEKEAAASPLSVEAREALYPLLRNKTLLSTGEDSFTPSRNYQSTRGWLSLTGDEKLNLKDLFQRKLNVSESLWEQSGRELLSMMKTDGSMLVCAEDLGAIPPSVPGVLQELGILGLKVTRWSRKWDEPSQPYIPFSDYPELSVATSSVHDSTTLRGWLAGEAFEDKELLKVLGLKEDADLSGSAGVKAVLEALQKAPSMVAAYPIQDLLALIPDCVSENPEDERINIPGTVQPGNWTWRMKISLEELPVLHNLNNALKELCSLRRNQ